MKRPSSVNDRKRNRILFDFESIVDIKLSYINYLKNTTPPDSADPVALEDPIDVFKLTHMTVYENPIARVFKEGKIPEDLDLSHLEYPVFTGMKLLVEQYLKTPDNLIRPTVLCRDELQERIIKNSIEGIRTIVGSRHQVKVLNFSRIVLGDIQHVAEFKDPVTTDFMVLNFRENMSEENPEILNRIAFIYGGINSFTIVKAYPEIEDPVG